MKTLLFGFFMAILFYSCDPNADKQIGRNDRIKDTNPNNGSGSNGNLGAGSTTDVPFDGGLGILLIAGGAFGIKRIRSTKQKLS